jgi:hypothetical protein
VYLEHSMAGYWVSRSAAELGDLRAGSSDAVSECCWAEPRAGTLGDHWADRTVGCWAGWTGDSMVERMAAWKAETTAAVLAEL